MANTLTVADGINLVAMKYPRLLTDGFASRIADEVIAFIWHRYPWRISLAELPPFFPVKEVPDYGPPTFSVPDDFYGLQEAWLRRSTGEKVEPRLTVKPSVEISIAPGYPTAIAYQPEMKSFRLHPRPSFSGPEIQVEGIYKKLPTKVTNENMNSYSLPWDDIYFQVFKKGLEWKIKDDIMGAADADRAYLMFRAFVDEMAANEGLHSGVITVAPAEGLALG